mgnify:CR=1 FL=1
MLIKENIGAELKGCITSLLICCVVSPNQNSCDQIKIVDKKLDQVYVKLEPFDQERGV